MSAQLLVQSIRLLTEPLCSLISNTVTWCSNNVEGAYKRGVTIGIVIGWGNLQGVVSFFLDTSRKKQSNQLTNPPQGQLEHLQSKGQAQVLPRPRSGVGILDTLPVLRKCVDALFAGGREQEEASRQARPLG